ncbi:High-affinity nitrate transporter 2.2 [Melia azedarach]|uniref:High-affinity nitrate transporter 2.2 n=1 Tax=Melia azedarach TaxID=155640 RepID=A0ACC1Z342_MELAZ|nr:High-affinity nitrate transporter 2.2 [Melia azedarach]
MEDPPAPQKPPFTLPVDADGKATEFRPFSLASPHVRSFHLAWLSLFSCFFSTFSIPPLIPIIREDLRLTETDIGAAGIASFVGSIFSRLAMGPACDLVGPRITSATLSLITAPIILATSLVSSPQSFILVRFLVGFCLANFVANQFWMSSMFSGCVVGLANGVSAGWANMGSGVAQLLMPLIFTAISNFNVPLSTAWRLAFIVPSLFQSLTAILVLLYGQDLPSGNYRDFKKTENDSKDEFLPVLLHGLKNYRGWILGLTYGFCFGVELTTDNIIAQYFYYKFNVKPSGSRDYRGVFRDGELVFEADGRGVFGCYGAAVWDEREAVGIVGGADAASGLTFGVVPFVTKRSLGVISGMTGSGGTVGAVLTQLLLFSGSKFSKQTSISLMGLMMIVCTLPVSLLYFPQSGGMFCGPSFDPNEAGEHYHLLE